MSKHGISIRDDHKPAVELGSAPANRTVHRGTALNGLFPQSFSADYLQLEEGTGPYVRDSDGNWYLDVVSGSKNVNIGYGRSEVARSAHAQMETLSYTNTTYANQPVRDLSAKLREFTPAGFNYAWFVSGGSLANESAFKMTRQFHLEQGNKQKYKIISRSGSFHGNTAGAMAVSGTPQFMSLMDPLYQNFGRVERPEISSVRHRFLCPRS